MPAKFIFRRIRGRLVPIKISQKAKDLTVGFAVFAGATSGAAKIRKKVDKKKRLTGLASLVTDIGVSAGLLTLLAIKGPSIFRRGIPAASRIVGGSFGFRAARNKARGF